MTNKSVVSALALPLPPSLRSSVREFEQWLFATNIFKYDFHYAKDIHFQQYLLTHHISSEEKFDDFLQELDHEAQQHPFYSLTFCNKALVAHNFANRDHSTIRGITISKLEWAIVGLASARRTCCLCHQDGSFALKA